ncbi:lycopene cyclase family protein [Gordonia crocea]|uniref:Putative carotenoid cyclase n=1 Tax=Gordonia crocea TaxID=589162 RepID=A0A7I9UY47_9ACTN|nr:lycopene cyclase family protein [Gordonia crocea]GED97806.1 putative carotenoid cyclase [Gordonia crocea]
MSPTPRDTGLDLVVVGAGPAGTALAHRGAVAGLSVALVDPQPHRPWSQTFGAFVDELPDWLPRSCRASTSDTVVVYTPVRRALPRPYTVLDNAALRDALGLAGVRIVTGTAADFRADGVRTDTGTVLSGRVVVDATGARRRSREHRGAAAGALPRQRAYGVIGRLDGPAETVLMDWRPASPGAPAPPTFGYRVPLGRGRFLVEETFLAGTPPTVELLAQRWAQRGTPAGWVRGDDAESGTAERVEVVDFPLVTGGPAPWREDGQPLAFGAAGGLMHPATGYSIAASLGCADTVVDAVVRRADPRAALWPRRARAVAALREAGLAALTGLEPDRLTAFFDAFFSLGADDQRAYLSSRDDLGGVLRAMRATFGALDWSMRRRIAAGAGAALMEQIRRSPR